MVYGHCLAGLAHIGDNPAVLLSFNPIYAVSFLGSHGIIGLVTLGAVFLAVTGAEALYADLGHFGKRPIQLAWIIVVFPALLLNYLGQGALSSAQARDHRKSVLSHDAGMGPHSHRRAGNGRHHHRQPGGDHRAFSLTRQAIQLGLLPRMEIRFTSEAHAGQIYMPQVNWLIMFGVLALVIMFKTSGSLASAYGIAVTGTMVVTSMMAIFVIWKYWKWPLWAALAMMLPLLAIDVIFLGANSLKVHRWRLRSSRAWVH